MESRNKNKEQKKSCAVVDVSSQDKHMNYASETASEAGEPAVVPAGNWIY